MTEERDPLIQSLFAEAESDLAGDDFTAIVMQRVAQERRIKRLTMIAIGLLLFLGFGLLALPLQGLVTVITEITIRPLIAANDPLLSVIFAPVNTIAGAAALCLLTFRMLYKLLFP